MSQDIHDDGLPLSPEDDYAVAIHEAIDAYEEGEEGSAFNLVVVFSSGRYHSLPYVEHSHGTIVLMDDTRQPPIPRVISMRSVAEVYVDPDCKSVVFGDAADLQRSAEIH